MQEKIKTFPPLPDGWAWRGHTSLFSAFNVEYPGWSVGSYLPTRIGDYPSIRVITPNQEEEDRFNYAPFLVVRAVMGVLELEMSKLK